MLTTKEKVDGLTGHFLPLYTLGVVARFVFWWYESAEFGRTLPEAYVLGLHAAHLLTCGTLLFAYALPQLQAYLGAADTRSSEAECTDSAACPCAALVPEMCSTSPPQEFSDLDGMPCSWR